MPRGADTEHVTYHTRKGYWIFLSDESHFRSISHIHSLHVMLCSVLGL